MTRMALSVKHARARRGPLVGAAACLVALALVAAAGCGGSSGVAVLTSADGGPDAQAVGDALVADGAPSGDGASAGDGARDGSDSATGTPKRVFVTSHVYKISAFGSLSGADTLCQQAADSIGLGAIFRAWLSDEFQSPAARLAHNDGPYVTLSKALVAADWAELTSGTLRHAIDESELRILPAGATACGGAWTGTLANGTASPGGTCHGWTDPMLNGTFGFPISTKGGWTNGCVDMCSATASLYCIEQ